MARCAACNSELASGARFCPTCGAPLEASRDHPGAGSGLPSPEPPAVRSAGTGPIPMPSGPGVLAGGSIGSSESFERFSPGTLLKGRYRVLGLAGRGAMGEVYRAEDLKLGETVALKFLPRAAAVTPAMMNRLYSEVRIAHQVTHPNVCRVHDIDELSENGVSHPFISMEFIDGEDIASLLRRIGRLPSDKAVHVAHQLCAGLAAAHDRGVLHRDIKPANVMLDSNGAVRLTDFGLAGLAEELKEQRVRAGTPAYMAPEQARGEGVSVRSDLYALGLVLYEVFTGKPLFRPQNYAELLEMHARSVTPPSELVPDLDPKVEAAILACLEADPASRPGSARDVAALLPGGGLLAAALAAGLTPSPDQVAASGDEGRLSPLATALWTALTVVSLLATILLSGDGALVNRAKLAKSEEVLADRAVEIVRQAGLEPPGGYRAFGFDLYEELLMEMAAQDDSAARWDRLGRSRPTPIDFWFRITPDPMVSQSRVHRVSMLDPPMARPGMVSVRLDPAGRLRELAVNQEGPGELEESGSEAAPREIWAPLMAAAGLDSSKLREVPPRRVPPVFGDHRVAWEGTYPESPDEPIRVEGASLDGRVVAFRIVELRWAKAAVWGDYRPVGEHLLGLALSVGVQVLLVLGAVALAWVNFHHRRGDRRAAMLVGAASAVVSFVAFICRATHQPDIDAEATLLSRALGDAAMTGLWFWVFYMGLEPYVRRVWPEMLISWTRLVSGRATDPLVGQHLLAGAALGAVSGAIRLLDHALPEWLRIASAPPMIRSFTIETLGGSWATVGALGSMLVEATRFSFAFVMAMVLLKLLVKRPVWAVSIYAALQSVIWTLVSGVSPASWAINAALASICALAAVRLGMLALAAGTVVFFVLTNFPLTIDTEMWYFPATLLASAIVLGLAGLGAYATRLPPPTFAAGRSG